MKDNYTIAEVSKAMKVSHSLLRFWEQKFDFLEPKKNNSGERVYSQKDLDCIKKIHFLVKKRGYTLEGAARMFKKFKTLKVKSTLDKLYQIEKMFKNILDNSK